MTTYARLVNGQAVDVTTGNPETLFHADIAAAFIVVPDGTVNGATYSGGTWAPPASPPAPIQQYRKQVSTVEFYMLFQSPERIAIRASSDLIVKDFMSIIDDVRTTIVDLANPQVIGAINYLATLTPAAITTDRAATILLGWPL